VEHIDARAAQVQQMPTPVSATAGEGGKRQRCVQVMGSEDLRRDDDGWFISGSGKDAQVSDADGCEQRIVGETSQHGVELERHDFGPGLRGEDPQSVKESATA
jgi:hypothetical protein